MRFLKVFVLTTSLAFLSIASFAQNVTKNSISSPVFQIIQDQLILDNSTIQSAAFFENKDGTFGGLQIEIKPSASKDFIRITKDAIGKRVNLVLNNKIISSATIQSTLQTKFLISGITKNDAQGFIDSLKK